MIITHKKPSPKIKSKQNKTKLSSSSLIQSNPAKQASGNKLDTIWRALHHRHTFSSSQDPQETNCDEPKPDKKNKRNLKSKEPAKKTLEKKSRKNKSRHEIHEPYETRTAQPSNFGDEEGKSDPANAIRALPQTTTTTTVTATIQKHANKRREHKSHYAQARTGAQIPRQNKRASAESELP
jgi:hypothetical protein